jgi:hypothetical protein
MFTQLKLKFEKNEYNSFAYLAHFLSEVSEMQSEAAKAKKSRDFVENYWLKKDYYEAPEVKICNQEVLQIIPLPMQ